MSQKTTAYIGLGSNLGDRANYINSALEKLIQDPNIELEAVSDMIETAPLAGADQPEYINAVAKINTSLAGIDLLKVLMSIEDSLRRVRTQKWAPRTIDLDILLYGSGTIDSPELIVPHPQMHLRSFVLAGICQLDPQLEHPVLNESMQTLADRLNGCDFALSPGNPQLVCVAGVIGVGKTTLIDNMAKQLDCKLIYEPYSKNPFLPKVYAGKNEMALDSQLYFLNNRVMQLKADWLGMEKIALVDYLFEKELIYARRTLNPEQLNIYQQQYDRISADAADPVLVIYLYDTPQRCLERIHKRNRPYEQQIKIDFLELLTADYEELLGRWTKSPVISLSKSDFDCTCDSDIEHLRKQIISYTVIQ